MSDSGGDEIVISGMAGRFPNSNNVSEFAYNIYNKIEMTDEDESRWKHFQTEVPKRSGKIHNLEKFDASFFSILNKHANATDPQMRILLENAYEAILDAGISPQSLVGSRTGVFIGNSYSDAKDTFIHRIPVRDGYLVLGNANFYLANRMSYILGLCGPSFLVDTACSSSAYALDCAYRYIKAGICDAAIVGGSQLILSCGLTSEYNKLGILAKDGERCRPFDKNATGFTRADGIGVVFLQKLKDSKRVYAKLIYSSCNNDGFKKEGQSFPSRKLQENLIESFYKELKFDTNLITFVEAHSTGTKLGDPEEVAAIDGVFCNENRKSPLLIGSVKSNMGHSEAASAIASIFKILLAFETGKIAPNINVTSPRSDVPAFAEGRIKVVTEVEDLNGEYIAMNSFGLGGANAHSLYKMNPKEKINYGIPNDNLSRLVLWSGRTEEAIATVFDDIIKRPLDGEFIALLQNSQKETTSANIYRGYGIFSHDFESEKAICNHREMQYFNGKHSIVWVFSGIGSQWPEMGGDLMKIPIFADVINQCHDILLVKGINLKDILTSSDKEIFNNVLHSYVGIVSIEIALTEVLKVLGLTPDFIIGHSAGEIGCAYADGCFNIEEAILLAYARGVASNESKTIPGAMAAVGMNHKDIIEMLPDDIDCACHNGIDSTTISGPQESVKIFMEELSSKNIFVKEVACSGVPLHSRYIKEMGEKLLASLQTIIKNPKKRSEKWLSSTFLESEWINEETQYSSAEYHANNLLNPVLFEEVTSMLPNDAITIEIAPHGLLKAILKRSLKSGIHISITERDNKDGVMFLLNNLGKLFNNGVDIDIAKLYPSIEFPVSRATPQISSIIKWNHEENYVIPSFDSFNAFERRNFPLSLSDKTFEYVREHVIDGRILVPAAGWIELVWETFARMNSMEFEKLKVVFEDIKFLRATSIKKETDVYVTVSIHRGSGKFEIIEGNSAVVSGLVRIAEDEQMSNIVAPKNDDAFYLTEDDFYKNFRMKGFHHQGRFRGVKEMRSDGALGKVKWDGNWTTFLDGMTHFGESSVTKSLVLPTYIRKLIIDPRLHFEIVEGIKKEQKLKEEERKLKGEKPEKSTLNSDETLIETVFSRNLQITKAGGVEIHQKTVRRVNRRRTRNPTLEVYKFIPHFSTEALSEANAAKVCVQMILENRLSNTFTSIEVAPVTEDTNFSELIVDAVAELPLIKPDINILTSSEIKIENVNVQDAELSSFNNVNLIIAKCLSEEFFESAKNVLAENGCIIFKGTKDVEIPSSFEVFSRIRLNDEFLHVFQKRNDDNYIPNNIVEITAHVDDWLKPLQDALSKNESILIYSQNEKFSGILGFFNCLRRETNGEKVRCVFIDDENAFKFDIEHPFYKSQLNHGHTINILKNGQWGSYRHLKLIQDIELKPQLGHCYVSCAFNGDLSTLSWRNGYIDDAKQKTIKEIIKIQYAPLNFKDIMFALDRMTPEHIFTNITGLLALEIGIEFSGVTSTGRRVMGIAEMGSFSTLYDASRALLWNAPDNWSLEEAATIPMAYFTTYFALMHTIKIQKGKSILIHAGSGGVGLASIQVALSYGLEVFTTVSTEKKKQFILDRFPEMKRENIGNSRDTSFEMMINDRTNGNGVDYVLNSLTGDKLQASIRCLARNGVFLEIGKFDIIMGTNIQMGHLAKGITFKAVIFDEAPFNSEEMQHVRKLVELDIEKGIVRPLSTTIYNANEIESAFRLMASGKHMGKILLKIREQNSPESLPIKVFPNIYCDSDKSYIIVGGMGGFGMELAEWLVFRRCHKLIISSSRGISNNYQRSKIEVWKYFGTKVSICTSNITTEDGCLELINEAIKLGPVGGIFNLAAVLRDDLLENLDTKMFNESLAPKADATEYLDILSRQLCPELEHFVVFSSVSCGRGNAAQCNYGMANSVMERIVEERHQLGLPGKAIQWGAIGDVGMLADYQLKFLGKGIGGMLPQGITSCLDTLDILLTSPEPIVCSMIVDDKQMTDAKKGNVVDLILGIMGIADRKSIPMDSTLTKLGIDSLMGVEIQQTIEREYEVSLTAQEIRMLTLDQLEKRVMTKETIIIDADLSVPDEMYWINLLFFGFGNEDKKNEVIIKANDILENGSAKALIIPGFLGMASDIYYAIAQQMKYPTYILQLYNTAELTELDQIIADLSSEIVKLFANEKHFLIVAHSFGSVLALKVAHLLEEQGKTGSLVQLDASPQYVQKFVFRIIPENQTDERIRSGIAMMCFNMFAPLAEEQDIVEKALAKPNWNGRLEALLKKIRHKIHYTDDYLHTTLSIAFFNRFKIALKADKISYPVLQTTQISLIKAAEQSLSDLDDDFGLQAFSLQPINVTNIDGNHVTFLNHNGLFEVINKAL